VRSLVPQEQLRQLFWLALSVEDVLEESFTRLTDKLKALLLNLSVYQRPFNQAAAAVQLLEEEVSEQDLRQLAKRSLSLLWAIFTTTRHNTSRHLITISRRSTFKGNEAITGQKLFLSAM
jgi:hypothetical protein